MAKFYNYVLKGHFIVSLWQIKPKRKNNTDKCLVVYEGSTSPRQYAWHHRTAMSKFNDLASHFYEIFSMLRPSFGIIDEWLAHCYLKFASNQNFNEK